MCKNHQKKKKKIKFLRKIVEEIKKIQDMLILKILNDFYTMHLYNIMIISMMEEIKHILIR